MSRRFAQIFPGLLNRHKALLSIGGGGVALFCLTSTVYSDGKLRISHGSESNALQLASKAEEKSIQVTKIRPPKETAVYSRKDVSEHNCRETGIWVTYMDGVYDVSDFVAIHPGGERILLAAGKAIDPFWAVFSIHMTKETRELLETYRIGTLLPRDQDPTYKEEPSGLEKLFANEPERDPSLKVLAKTPCNAEADVKNLETFITPNEKFYVRNHLPVPVVDPECYRLTVEGPGIPDDFELSLDDLKQKLPKYSVTATMQCAGNRRKEMHEKIPVKGLQWQSGAISNAVWTGVRLRDVLEYAGYKMPDYGSEEKFPGDVEHVVFDGLEGYGASIPAEKAFNPRGDVLLAYEMNGEPIPRDHGYPLRAVIPGVVAARSVKWLSKISLSEEESQSHWQQRDYKGFNPSADLASSDYSKSQSIQELPVQSSITTPTIGEDLKAENGFVTVKGYAIAGGGRAINRVDISSDGGKTWTDATLHPPNQSRGRTWAWTQWEAKIPVNNCKEMELVCKAVDESYNTQPDSFDGIYNVRGVLVSAWQRIKTKIVN